MTSPIITVTLNPAIDRTVWIERLVPGHTHRSADARTTFGGKGINVARTVAGLGVPVFALGIAGEDQWASIEQHLGSLGVQARFLATPGETRTNLKLIEQETGRLTEINGSGPDVSPDLVASFERELISTVRRTRANTVVLAGSLPLGVDTGVYAKWTRRLQGLEPYVQVLVDASGEVLEQAAAAEPFLLKPNRVEAEGLLGHPIEGLDDAVSAALALERLGPRGILLSLGNAGAVACYRGETEIIAPRTIAMPSDRLLTTVGAGDAMVARIAVEMGRRGPGELQAADFFAMCRAAVAQAEEHIGSGTPSIDSALTPAGAPATGPSGTWQSNPTPAEAPMRKA